MVHQPCFHVGILVRDIEAAAADFAALVGAEFEPVRSQELATGDTARLCYTLQGPPYLELIEMTGTGIYSPAHGEGLHHIGLTDPDVPGRCAAFGGAADNMMVGADGSPLVALTRADQLHGVRLEYFDANVAAQFLGYLRARSDAS